jgi:hypothetical protein
MWRLEVATAVPSEAKMRAALIMTAQFGEMIARGDFALLALAALLVCLAD